MVSTHHGHNTACIHEQLTTVSVKCLLDLLTYLFTYSSSQSVTSSWYYQVLWYFFKIVGTAQY